MQIDSMRPKICNFLYNDNLTGNARKNSKCIYANTRSKQHAEGYVVNKQKKNYNDNLQILELRFIVTAATQRHCLHVVHKIKAQNHIGTILQQYTICWHAHTYNYDCVKQCVEQCVLPFRYFYMLQKFCSLPWLTALLPSHRLLCKHRLLSTYIF